MSIVYNYLLYFFIYSFLGWVCESIYCSCLQKKVINRGFLNGPVCPVYGVGALIIITGCWSYRDSLIAVFISGMVLTSLLEYITATILEKLFHAKWWDYSEHRCNINGKVCLLNSTLFGFMSVFVIEILHPFVIKELDKMNSTILFVFLILALMSMISDLIVTAKALNTLTVKVDALTAIVDDMKKIQAKFKLYEDEEFLHKLKLNPEGVAQRLKTVSEKYGDLTIQNRIDEMQEKFRDLKKKAIIHRRLVNAFPNMRSVKSKKRDAHFQYIKKMLREKR
ncbi:MAG: putative ABC transporter permease [Intestinibacter bartlettii]|uniref:putative ABC transporter permease n=1 Tax=Intestinibacter bartlettii TaxID=261299 RepID=UPI0026F30B46|nr:putative ABC transporter permease [Intestinibacter bartlettii]MDO5010721.1 putative ABC transporter permease [Intestinibacter bartlettii]